jgi:hypothetical protein
MSQIYIISKKSERACNLTKCVTNQRKMDGECKLSMNDRRRVTAVYSISSHLEWRSNRKQNCNGDRRCAKLLAVAKESILNPLHWKSSKGSQTMDAHSAGYSFPRGYENLLYFSTSMLERSHCEGKLMKRKDVICSPIYFWRLIDIHSSAFWIVTWDKLSLATALIIIPILLLNICSGDFCLFLRQNSTIQCRLKSVKEGTIVRIRSFIPCGNLYQEILNLVWSKEV